MGIWDFLGKVLFGKKRWGGIKEDIQDKTNKTLAKIIEGKMCPFCGKDTDPADEKCPACGKELKETCRKCGAKKPIAVAACPSCGGKSENPEK